MTDNSKTPLYSLVTCGRNDNYNPDFLYRLQTMLNFNARALEKIGRLDAVEFVVVDWGSVVPLREAVALDAIAASATSFLEISPETAAQLSDIAGGLNGPRAQNTGVRRAQGRFVGIQGADLLMTSASWRALLWALEDRHEDFPALHRSVLQIPRRTVPWSFVARQPDLDRWEGWLLTRSQVTTTPSGSSGSLPAVGGGMGVIILHRELWHDANALEETFPAYGYTDVDLVLRVTAHHPWIDAGAYGAVCFKMEHAPKGLRGRLFSKEGGSTISINSPWITTSLASRYADWGLPNLALEAKKAQPRAKHGNGSRTSPAGHMRDHWPESIGEGAERYFDKDVRRHVRATLRGARMSMYDEPELEMLHVLSWFGLRKFPMTYLEIGLRHHFYVRAIANACPSVDIYIQESEETDRDGVMHKVVDICENLLWAWGHKGYLRAAAGNLLANFRRLEQSFIGPFELEAVTLRLEKPGDVQLFSPALGAVVHGGLLAIQAVGADLLDAALKAYASPALDAHVIRGHSGRTAFLFVNKKELRDPVRKISPDARSNLLRIPSGTKFRFHAADLRRRLRRKLSRMGKISK